MRAYELMTIFRPEMAEADVQKEVERVESALTERGAEITLSDFWGKRRFAYEIDHLNGILFIDHVSMLKRNMALTKMKKLKAQRAGKRTLRD